MSVAIDAKTTGGSKLKQHVANARRARGVGTLHVGFFSTARYPDGTPVSNVAAWQEFGTVRIPERPFMRQAVANISREGIKSLAKADPATLVVTTRIADLVGLEVAAEIKRRLRDLRTPPLAPATVARRIKQSDNPLIDTGFLRNSVTHVVVE